MHAHPHGDLADVSTRPGIRARSLAGPKHGLTAFFLQENRLEHGATIPLHLHPSVQEVLIVTAGELTVETDGETLVVPSGHTLVIPPATAHRLSNRGSVPCTMLAAAAWDHTTFYRDGSQYLEGEARQ